MHTLPKSLGGMDKVIKRFKAAKGRKDTWVTHLQDCYQYALPQRETFYRYQDGQKKNLHIYDDTAQIAVQRFASRLQSTLVPPWRQWSLFRPGSDIPEDKHDTLIEQMDEVTKIVFDHINHSNFATQSNECFLELSIGTGALICNEGPLDRLLDFQAVPIAEIFPEEGVNGTIETVWREHEVVVGNIEQTWKGAELSDSMQKLKKDKPHDKITLIEGSIHDPELNEYHTVVLSQKEKHVVFTETNETSAWIVPRWSVVAGETLGRGPVMAVLPTIKTCNKVVEFTLRNAQLAIAGTYTGVSDGVMNPYTARLAPGVIIPVGSNASANPSLKALERTGDFNVSELILADMRDDIKTALFNNMRQPDDTVVSATQFAIENKELVDNIGSSFGRLQTEFVERTLKRVVSILAKNGKIPAIAVDGKTVTLKHTSPLAKAQDMEDLMTFNQFTESLMQFGPEAAMLGMNIPEIPEYLAKKLGVDKKLYNSPDKITETMNQAKQMATDNGELAPEE